MEKLRLTWLVTDDLGGGIVSVAQACCRQAALCGHDVTLLMLLPPTGHAAEFGGVRVESLQAKAPYSDTPGMIVDWLRRNPQDIVLLNGCEQADVAIRHIPADTRVIYVVHDTAGRYFDAAVANEAALDAIVCVSETVGRRIRYRLSAPQKLHVAHNGTLFPFPVEYALDATRADDLIFLGGDNTMKGSHDALAVWAALQLRKFSGRLHWFGHVGDDLRAEIARTPATDRIVLHGWRPRLDIFAAAARSRILLMLSRVEPFGMVTVECMGMGCLAAAWDIDTGTREIVAPGECAVAALGDYDRIADGVLEMLAVHEKRFRQSTLRIRTSFDDAAMWSRYVEIIDWIKHRAPAPRPLSQSPPPPYRAPLRLFQMLPATVRQSVRNFVGRSPRLGYLFRDFRGR